MSLFQAWTGSRLIPALCLAVALGVLGCGPGTSDTSLTGVVKLGDKPITAGSVSLIPQEGSDTAPRNASIQADGHYTFLAPLPVGAAKFTVTVPTQSSNPNVPAPPAIPAKYADKDQSGLTYTIKEGKNTHDLELAP